MYQCKSSKHWWLNKADADKCCNGYHRELILGRKITAQTPNYDIEAETAYGFVWVKDKVTV